MSDFTPKVVIFDLDGTLLNSIADLGIACNHALETYGFPTHAAEEYPHLVGNGVNRLIERALPVGHKDEATVLRLREAFIPYYDTHNCVHTRPYPGIPELLDTLKQRGVRLAVASNKYQDATARLVKHFFPNMFDVVLGERPQVPRKPEPQIVYDILRALSIGQDENILYVGDSLVDIQTAHNARVPMVACTWGFCSETALTDAHPDYLVHAPEEIAQIAFSATDH